MSLVEVALRPECADAGCISYRHHCGRGERVVTSYERFVESKRQAAPAAGFDPGPLNPALFDWQRELVAWALNRGRAAIFADCGLGKTPMQLEWAWRVHKRTGGDVLILAPLAVATQTLAEAAKFGIPARVVREAAEVRSGINIANYERLHRFQRSHFVGLVLDESSILKGFDGKTRRALNEFGAGIRYRLCCTATPAPNDTTELTRHAEFLGIAREKEILALYFTQDGNSTQKWRIKGHARSAFWEWMASWARALRAPSDLGHPDDGFVLPALRMHDVQVMGSNVASEDRLFGVEAQTMDERRAARRESTTERVAATAELVNASDEPWVVWCDLNAESDALRRAIPDSVEVRGSDPLEAKEERLRAFTDGAARVIVTKPTIAGFGLNWQHCHNMAFVGLSDSYEQQYQAIRRCWRFGQTEPVDVYVVTADQEGAVVRNIKRKEAEAAEAMAQIVAHMGRFTGARNGGPVERDEASGSGWTLHLGDSVQVLPEIADETVGLTVFSPPFPGMYVYTDSPHDMGNVASIEEMIGQFSFLVPELLRVTRPGRSCAIHLTQAMAHKGTDGYAGLRDFRGVVIAAMEEGGWHYYGEVTIDKDPQVKAIRTKDRGLLFKTLATDAAHMRMALADYLIQFRRPGDNEEPIRAGVSDKYRNPDGWISDEEWIEWAAPVWYRAQPGRPGGIRETDVLNVSAARDEADERHLCPLQLGVIERAVKLWSNPGDVILSPFAGVGSEGVGALRLGRRFLGIELKRSYFEQAVRNLRAAEGQLTLTNGGA